MRRLPTTTSPPPAAEVPVRRHRGLLAPALATLLATAVSAAPADAAGRRPDFQLPFKCRQTWQIDSYGRDHAPALDMVRDPDSERGTTEGQPVLAPADGTVNQSFFHGNAGNTIQINHGGGWFTTYIHLQARDVAVGAKVRQGQRIGRVGHTGPTSNGTPHLHYELAVDTNGDGSASWGEPGAERVPAWFNGVRYGARTGETHHNVASRNGCGGRASFSGDGRADLIVHEGTSLSARINRGGRFDRGRAVGSGWGRFHGMENAGHLGRLYLN